MNKAFSKEPFINYPSTDTPLDAEHLNPILDGLDEVDNRVIDLDSNKASKIDLQTTNTTVENNKKSIEQTVADNKSATDKTISDLTTVVENNKSEIEKTVSDNKDDADKKITDLTSTVSSNKSSIEKTVADNKNATDKAISDLSASVDKKFQDVTSGIKMYFDKSGLLHFTQTT